MPIYSENINNQFYSFSLDQSKEGDAKLYLHGRTGVFDEIDYTAGVTSTTGETASSVSSTGAPISSSTPSSSPSSTASTKPTSSPSATASTSETTAPTQRPTAVPANQNGPIIIN